MPARRWMSKHDLKILAFQGKSEDLRDLLTKAYEADDKDQIKVLRTILKSMKRSTLMTGVKHVNRSWRRLS